MYLRMSGSGFGTQLLLGPLAGWLLVVLWEDWVSHLEVLRMYT